MGWLAIIREFGQFVAERKKYVLLPILVVLLLMAALVLLAEIPALTPFIYALF